MLDILQSWVVRLPYRVGYTVTDELATWGHRPTRVSEDVKAEYDECLALLDVEADNHDGFVVWCRNDADDDVMYVILNSDGMYYLDVYDATKISPDHIYNRVFALNAGLIAEYNGLPE
jgi:hypothetical protein